MLDDPSCVAAALYKQIPSTLIVSQMAFFGNKWLCSYSRITRGSLLAIPSSQEVPIVIPLAKV
jgi:hypothetical protein